KLFEPAVDPFESGIYSKEATAMTYGRMLLAALEKIETGNSVILDATFSRKHQRQEALRLAQDKDCNIIFIECKAPRNVLIQRLKRRDREPSISDARFSHLDRLRKRFQPIDDISNQLRIVIDTHRSLEINIRKILEQEHLIISKSIEERLKRRA
ncbi:MAG: AAA family ATPase, partial [Thermodesulfobacteriota bacterium]